MRIGYLIAREASSHLRSTRFRIASALAIALTILTVAIGVEDYRVRQDEFQRLANETAAAQARLKTGLAAFGAQPTLRVVHPPSVGGVIVRGLEGTFPSYWDFVAATTIEGPPAPEVAQGSDVGSLVDLEAIVRILLGLLAIAMGVESISGERAAGTLASLLSQPVRPGVVAVGKLAGSVAALAACVALICASILFVLWLGGFDLAIGGTGITLTVLGVASIAYLAIMVALGMAIGALIRSPSAAFTVSMGVWLTLTLGGPMLAHVGPRAFSDQSTRPAVEARLLSTYAATKTQIEWSLGDRYLELPPDLLTKMKPGDASVGELRLAEAWLAAVADLRGVLEGSEARWRDTVAIRARWTHRLSWISPATTYLLSATALAGTGDAARAHWQSSVDQYKEQLNARLFDAPQAINIQPPDSRGRAIRQIPLRPNPITVQDVGTIVPPGDSMAQRVHDARWELLVLAIYLAALSVLATVVFPRAGF